MATTWTDTPPVPADFEPRLLAYISSRLSAGDKPTRLGAMDFPLFDDDPLAAVHQRIERYLADAQGKYDLLNRRAFKVRNVDAASEMLDAPPVERVHQVRAALMRELWFWKSRVRRSGAGEWTYSYDDRLFPLKPLISALVRGVDSVSADALQDVVDAWALPRVGSNVTGHLEAKKIVDWVERAAAIGLDPIVQRPLKRIAAHLRSHSHAYGSGREALKLSERLKSILAGPDAQTSPAPLIESGEAWAEAAAATFERASNEHAARWRSLLEAAKAADGSKPTKKWLKEMGERVRAVGPVAFVEAVSIWFDKAPLPRTRPLVLRNPWNGVVAEVPYQKWSEANETILKGLAWACGTCDDSRLAKPLGTLYAAAYKKLPDVGPRSPKVGNAALWALTQLPGDAGAGEIVRLRSAVKQPTGRKNLDKAIADMARARGIEPADLEELSVDDFGLVDGVRTIVIGDTVVRITAAPAGVTVAWVGADGKTRASPPAAIKAAHADAVKQVAAVKKAIDAALLAQRDRLERGLLRRSPWSFETWRPRYVDHPLVGLLAKQLIWEIDSTPVLYRDGQFEIVTGHAAPTPKSDAAVRLWHPIQSNVADIAAWRERLTTLGLTQPFKQTYREIYPLTDAERTTATYSNRFAGHVIRQHQFKALADGRGWKYALMGGFDFHNTPAIDLPAWDVRAEFWVDVASGSAMAASGIAMHLTTDQVRFTRPGRTEPLPLQDVPPLAFSELMRHVDLFVGVASVGNDPSWQDGGPDGRYRDYWQSYSFGDLNETANTRRAVLAGLLPRLTKLRDKWELGEKFLAIRGKLRTYKIHLGSGNILMEPNDQYLCIVPDRSSAKTEGVFLPFEGDQTLSIILSKAFLLAEDDKIKDPTITRQIGRSVTE